MPLSNNLNTRSVVNRLTRGFANNVTQSRFNNVSGVPESTILNGFTSGSASGSRQVLLSGINNNQFDTVIGSVQLSPRTFLVVYGAGVSDSVNGTTITIKGFEYQGFNQYATSSQEIQISNISTAGGGGYMSGKPYAIARASDTTAILYIQNNRTGHNSISKIAKYQINYYPTSTHGGGLYIPSYSDDIDEYQALESSQSNINGGYTIPAGSIQFYNKWMDKFFAGNDRSKLQLGIQRYKNRGPFSPGDTKDFWSASNPEDQSRFSQAWNNPMLQKAVGICLGNAGLPGFPNATYPEHLKLFLWVGFGTGRGYTSNSAQGTSVRNRGLMAQTTTIYHDPQYADQIEDVFDIQHTTVLGDTYNRGRYQSALDPSVVDLGRVGKDKNHPRMVAAFCTFSGRAGFGGEPRAGKIMYNLIGVNDHADNTQFQSLPIGHMTQSEELTSPDGRYPGFILSGSGISDDINVNNKYRFDNNNVYSLRENYILLGATNYDSSSYQNEAWLIKHETGSGIIGTLRVVHTASISPKLSSNLSGSFNRRSIVAGSLVDDFSANFNGVNNDRYPTDTDFFFVNYNDQVSADHNSGSLTLGKLTIDYAAETITANITGSDCLVICDDQAYRSNTPFSNNRTTYPDFFDLYFHSGSEATIVYRDIGDGTGTQVNKPIVAQSIRIE